MKKRLFIFPILVSFLVTSPFFVSCKSEHKPVKPKKEKVEVKQKIQDTFFGMKLGKTKLSEAKAMLETRNLEYEIYDGAENEIVLLIPSLISFGGIQWWGTQFSFYKGIFYSIGFRMTYVDEHELFNRQKNEVTEAYQTLIKKLKNKYPKYSYKEDKDTTNAKICYHYYYEAKDNTKIVSLGFDNNYNYNKNMLISLDYTMKDKELNKIDKTTASEL